MNFFTRAKIDKFAFGVPGRGILRFYFFLLIGIFIHCSQTTQESISAPVTKSDGKIFIVDQTGKKWDVTFAKNQLGLEPHNFQYGLGPNAIFPVVKPEFISPGDAGYPSPQETFLIIGFNLNGDIRAYPLSMMRCHEIANDTFGSTHLAVAY